MSPPPDDLEAVLCAAYHEQAGLYARALPLCAPPADGELPPANELVALLNEVAAVEARIAAAKARWRQEGRTPGAALQQALARVAELLRALSARIDGAIGDVEVRRARLMPQLEGLSQARRMEQAYRRMGRAS